MYEPFNLFDFFCGSTRVEGIFEDRSGQLRRRFEVDIQGSINDRGQLVLEEEFFYHDGHTQQQTWYIEQLDFQHYRGSCEGIVGSAEGTSGPGQFHWQYQFLLPVGQRRYKVSFQDHFYQLDQQRLLNRALVRKWGILLGSATMVFQRR